MRTWNYRYIGDIFKVTSGGTPSRKKAEYFENGNIPWVKTGDLKNKYVKMPGECITEEALQNSSAKLFPPNTVLLAMYGATIGACSILPFEAATNQACAALLPTESCDEVYLYYYLKSIKDKLVRRGVGGAQPNISGGIIKRTKIPLPPLPSQQKIAGILDEADKLRRLSRSVVEVYDRLSQSLFLEMFGDPVVNEKGWEKREAAKYIDFITGYPFKSSLYSNDKNDIRLCGGLIIMPWGLDWEKANYWEKSLMINMDKYWLREHDIVMAMDRPWISSGFKIAILQQKDIPSLLVQRTARIRGKGINQVYLFHLFKSTSFEIHAKPTETTVPHISPKDIKSYKLLLPPLALQAQFADRIKAIEVQKAQAELALAESEALFGCLLQRAFRGELGG